MIKEPSKLWTPLRYTKPLTSYTRGGDITDFTSSMMKAERGYKKGQRITLSDWQEWLMDAIFEEKEDGYLRYRRVLIGLPRKNGKSILGSSIALEHLLYGDEGTQVYSAARDREQAKIVFDSAKKQIGMNLQLQRVLKVYRDKIENKKTGAIYRAISADAMSAQGLGPSLVVADELHAWHNGSAEEMFAALTEGSADRPESMFVGITTAGDNYDTLLGKLCEHGDSVADGSIVDDAFGYFWWGAEEEDDIFDEKTWLKANPGLYNGLMSHDDFKSTLTLGSSTGNLNDFKRYKLNQWVRTDGNENYFSSVQWAKAFDEKSRIVKGEKICVGFDGSLSDDSTAFVGISLATGSMEILAKWEKNPEDPDWIVPREEVIAEQIRIFTEYDVVKMWCDPAFFQTDVEVWARQNRGVVERIPQSITRMGPMTSQFKIDIVSSEIWHNNDPAFTSHAMNAIKRDSGTISKEKRNSKRKIDFIVCAILANGARNNVLKRGKKAVKPIILGRG